MNFEWDDAKNEINKKKHGVSFATAQHAFFDPNRVIAIDAEHSNEENRKYCIGMIGEKILTVCFTVRENTIRIISAGYWRKGKQLYEQTN